MVDTEYIQLKGVTKRFHKNLVLDSINLDIPEKKITGIIGASGEGKSTILKLIIGFYKPTSGQVLYLRRNVLRDWKNIKKIFGFATEEGSFYEHLTVKENFFHFGYLYRMRHEDIKNRADEILGLVGLQDALHTRAKNLSIGMKKRLDVACSLVHNPDVLIMDEPTADLDPLLRAQILALIEKINEQGTTIIMTTQILEEMEEIGDKIAILSDKKIIEEGSPFAVKGRYRASSLNEVFRKIFSKQKKHFHEIFRTHRAKPQPRPQEKEKPQAVEQFKENVSPEIKGPTETQGKTMEDVIDGKANNENKNNLP
ncbi:ABC transporter ATP-binding protein [Candidatus Pacearchaeota archaeon]|nr:ABC transporter ATP-binding protein [Candidatus Pacearchaeota archaeon]